MTIVDKDDPRIPMLRSVCQLKEAGGAWDLYIGKHRLGEICRAKDNNFLIYVTEDATPMFFDTLAEAADGWLVYYIQRYEAFIDMVHIAEKALQTGVPLVTELMIGTVWAMRTTTEGPVHLDMRVKMPEGVDPHASA